MQLEFERAAQLRDRMNAIEALGQKQLVTAGRMADTDAPSPVLVDGREGAEG